MLHQYAIILLNICNIWCSMPQYARTHDKITKRGCKWFGGIKNCLKMPFEDKIATHVNNSDTRQSKFSITTTY